MDIQLKMLKQLRDEIEKLNKNKQDVQLECYNNSNRISSTLNEIQNLESKYDNDRELFEKESRRKIGYYILPFSIILSCFIGVVSLASLYSEIGMVISSLFTFLLSGMTFAFSYDGYLSNVNIWYDYENKNSQRRVDRWRKFLFKKYPQ